MPDKKNSRRGLDSKCVDYIDVQLSKLVETDNVFFSLQGVLSEYKIPDVVHSLINDDPFYNGDFSMRFPMDLYESEIKQHIKAYKHKLEQFLQDNFPTVSSGQGVRLYSDLVNTLLQCTLGEKASRKNSSSQFYSLVRANRYNTAVKMRSAVSKCMTEHESAQLDIEALIELWVEFNLECQVFLHKHTMQQLENDIGDRKNEKSLLKTCSVQDKHAKQHRLQESIEELTNKFDKQRNSIWCHGPKVMFSFYTMCRNHFQLQRELSDDYQTIKNNLQATVTRKFLERVSMGCLRGMIDSVSDSFKKDYYEYYSQKKEKRMSYIALNEVLGTFFNNYEQHLIARNDTLLNFIYVKVYARVIDYINTEIDPEIHYNLLRFYIDDCDKEQTVTPSFIFYLCSLDKRDIIKKVILSNINTDMCALRKKNCCNYYDLFILRYFTPICSVSTFTAIGSTMPYFEKTWLVVFNCNIARYALSIFLLDLIMDVKLSFCIAYLCSLINIIYLSCDKEMALDLYGNNDVSLPYYLACLSIMLAEVYIVHKMDDLYDDKADEIKEHKAEHTVLKKKYDRVSSFFSSAKQLQKKIENSNSCLLHGS
jgi:hypothetical protein